jgi:hypothetical protein
MRSSLYRIRTLAVAVASLCCFSTNIPAYGGDETLSLVSNSIETIVRGAFGVVFTPNTCKATAASSLSNDLGIVRLDCDLSGSKASFWFGSTVIGVPRLISGEFGEKYLDEIKRIYGDIGLDSPVKWSSGSVVSFPYGSSFAIADGGNEGNRKHFKLKILSIGGGKAKESAFIVGSIDNFAPNREPIKSPEGQVIGESISYSHNLTFDTVIASFRIDSGYELNKLNDKLSKLRSSQQ